ncbi:type I polyketide synthase [Chondromyces crocatus]|uniref:Glycolipid synthase n=1 Tax=Chondromyces crocatus TaxID=52 RepID=A0A0K1EBK3_CHOCO|nr:type I polyketide synthase [Chondromyces crocatus]AKT38229.1 glycolipid synthase [Chondromyces crocatus]
MSGFFVVPYCLKFEDTMAYGSHHYLTNFRFQCIARETLYFAEAPDGTLPFEEDRAIRLLTTEGYSRNLAPVRVGERVTIFMTLGAVTPSSVYGYFRTVRFDGEPVACGYQRLVTVSATSEALAPLPRSVTRHVGSLDEGLEHARFVELVLRGGGALRELFPERLRRYGAELAREGLHEAKPHRMAWRGEVERAGERGRVALLLPGQGSFDLGLLRGLCAQFEVAREAVAEVEPVAQALLGGSLTKLVVGSEEVAREGLAACPDLDQFGILVQDHVAVALLRAAGLRPDVVAGHSFGEIPAVAAGGGWSLAQAAAVVGRRVLALRQAPPGRMLAVQAGAERLREAIHALGRDDVFVGVLNAAEQTVASGSVEGIAALMHQLERASMRATLLASRYAFHSPLLAPAVGPFAGALQGIEVAKGGAATYSTLDRVHYGSGPLSPARLLPMHMVTQLDFAEAVRSLHDAGCRTFVECGGGSILTALTRRNLPSQNGVRVLSCFRAGEDVVSEHRRVLEALRVLGEDLSEVVPRAASAQRAREVQGETVPSSSPEVRAEARDAEPIAIVGMGAVLPGAGGVEAYLAQLRQGTSGIVDDGARFPDLRTDFLSEGRAADKTYSLLVGAVDTLGPYAQQTGYDAEQLERLPKTARMLACALAEAKESAVMLQGGGALRVACVLGSTADGSIEHDEAALLLGVEQVLAGLSADAAEREAVMRALAEGFGLDEARRAACRGHLEPLERVVQDVLGAGGQTVLVDAACASSMHAVHLGAAMLRRGLADVVVAGGVYQPGPPSACQFSQFGGLSATGSRPLDASADGVVFGEGAAVVVLERLGDAVARGRRVDAVLVGSGLSSDGPSPSVTVPQRQGQTLAMRRAHADAGVSSGSLQYVEAHATATPVGDATEFQALVEVFGEASGTARIGLGSVKSLLGHTGWAAGVASLLKVVLALRERTIFPQHGFRAPSERIELAKSPFVIPTKALPWEAPASGEPRRAGLDSFGFGGTNAHLVVEEFSGGPASARRGRPAEGHRRLCVIGVGSVFPGSRGEPAEAPSGVLSFEAGTLGLPARAPVLPDAREAMDAAQLLAVMASEQALSALPVREIGDRIGVVIGHEGKTLRGARVNERLFADRVARWLGNREVRSELSGRVVDALREGSPAAGPYTQPGNMPNIVSGRVANVFGLRGPNFVVDTSGTSLLSALAMADLALEGDCEVVLAGAVNAFGDEVARGMSAGEDPRAIGEGAVVVALCTEATAARHGWPVLAHLQVTSTPEADRGREAHQVGQGRARMRGAEGAQELTAAVRGARAQKAAMLSWPGESRRVQIAPPPGLSGFVTGTPIQHYVPTLVRSMGANPAGRVPGRVLYVCAEAALAEEVRAEVSAGAVVLSLGCPGGEASEGTLQPREGACPSIDGRDEERLLVSFDALAPRDVDAVVVLSRATEGRAFLDGTPGSYQPPMRALFGAARRYYDAIARGEVAFAAIVLKALDGGRLTPLSGVAGGFAKALARELPAGDVRVVHADCTGARGALDALFREWRWARPEVPEEVVDVRGERHVVALAEAQEPVRGGEAALDANSVVLVTGGARGITAILLEALIERFGCRAVLLGRSRLEDAPPHTLAMNDAEFEAYERDFYAEALRADRNQKIAALRERYGLMRAAREVHQTLARLRGGAGRVDYHAVDVSRGEDVDRAVAKIAAVHGRLDLVVHGAGIQVSSRLPSKSLALFERIVDTKLAGLGNIHRALARHLPTARPHFHLVTSAFSALGNDGQPDYGAANEAMNRAASLFSGGTAGQVWSSLAWLGWNGVGMTAGSEYSALGAARGLRGIEADEGRHLFLDLVTARPRGGAFVLLTDAERARFQPRFAAGMPPSGDRGPGSATPRRSWTLDPRLEPWLSGHRAQGKIVVAGAFLVELAVRHALGAAPGEPRVVREVRDVRFFEFLRLQEAAAREVHTVTTRQVSLGGGRLVSTIEVRGDFVHASGVVLREDILFARCDVELGAQRDAAAVRSRKHLEGPSLRDPYARAGAPLEHAGWFDHLRSFVLGDALKASTFHAPRGPALEPLRHAVTPFLLLDALLTLGTLHRDPAGSLPVCAAGGMDRIRFGGAMNDLALGEAPGQARLVATVPLVTGERVLSAWAQAFDPAGEVLLDVEGLQGHVVGRVAVEGGTKRPMQEAAR